jgi:hypothetical protein
MVWVFSQLQLPTIEEKLLYICYMRQETKTTKYKKKSCTLGVSSGIEAKLFFYPHKKLF